MTVQSTMTQQQQGGGQSASALAAGLGWFSIGLGLTQMMAPRALTRSLGMEGRERMMQACGMREIANGVGILVSGNRAAPWLWGRVAGDSLDMAALAANMDERNPRRDNINLALAAVAAVSALDIACAKGLGQESGSTKQALPPRDYSDRTGFPKPPSEMRGVARQSFEMPRDMKTPEPLLPYAVS